MMTIRTVSFSMVCWLGGLAIACSSNESGPNGEESSALADVVPKLGVSEVALPDGRLASAIGVLKGKIYVGLNNDFGHFISVDVARMRVVDSWGPRDALRLRGQEGVAADGDKLVLLGYDRDGARGDQFAYVLTWFDPATRKIEKSVRISLDATIVDPGDPLIDRPNAAFAIGGGKVFLAMTHKRVNKLVTFAVPSARESVINREGELFREGVGLTPASKGLALDGTAVYVAVPKNANDGTLERVDLERGTKTKVGEKLGYPVAVHVADGKLFVADHNGRLVVLDQASGAKVREEDAGGWVDDMTIAGDYVYLAVRGHFFVTKVRP